MKSRTLLALASMLIIAFAVPTLFQNGLAMGDLDYGCSQTFACKFNTEITGRVNPFGAVGMVDKSDGTETHGDTGEPFPRLELRRKTGGSGQVG